MWKYRRKDTKMCGVLCGVPGGLCAWRHIYLPSATVTGRSESCWVLCQSSGSSTADATPEEIPYEVAWSCWPVMYTCTAFTHKLNYLYRFITRQHTDARYRYSNSVRPSVRDTLVLYENGSTYRHSFFTNHSSFTSIKHLHEIPTGSPPAGALNTGGV